MANYSRNRIRQNHAAIQAAIAGNLSSLVKGLPHHSQSPQVARRRRELQAQREFARDTEWSINQ